MAASMTGCREWLRNTASLDDDGCVSVSGAFCCKLEQACNRLILVAVMFDQLLDLRRVQIERQIVSSNRDRCLQSRFAATLKYPLQWLSLRLLDESLENA